MPGIPAMKLRFRSLLLLAGLALSPLVSVATVPVLSDAEIIRLAGMVPPPPADDTPAGMADLETLLQVQGARTPEQEGRAARVVKHTPFQMGAAVFGPEFTAEKLPETARFFELVWEQMHAANKAVKQKFNRPRPSTRDARVQPCVPVPASPSYPSGHSIHATVWADLLGAAFPEHAGEFDAAARETRWARVLGGVHFPSDTQAGRLFGDELAHTLLAAPEIQAGLAAMRSEVAALGVAATANDAGQP